MSVSSITIGNWTGFVGCGLAARELEAVLHCANDRTVKAAARAMNVAPDTVSKRLLNVKFKLGVSSLRGVVLEAFRRGLITAASCSAPANPDPQHDRDQDQHHGVFVA